VVNDVSTKAEVSFGWNVEKRAGNAQQAGSRESADNEVFHVEHRIAKETGNPGVSEGSVSPVS
jgi:hypothetical protein